MNPDRWIPHALMPARTGPADDFPEAPRNDPLVRASRGILILALALGGLGAGAVASSAYGSVGQANAHQPAGNIRLTASAHPTGSSHITPETWMY